MAVIVNNAVLRNFLIFLLAAVHCAVSAPASSTETGTPNVAPSRVTGGRLSLRGASPRQFAAAVERARQLNRRLGKSKTGDDKDLEPEEPGYETGKSQSEDETEGEDDSPGKKKSKSKKTSKRRATGKSTKTTSTASASSRCPGEVPVFNSSCDWDNSATPSCVYGEGCHKSDCSCYHGKWQCAGVDCNTNNVLVAAGEPATVAATGHSSA